MLQIQFPSWIATVNTEYPKWFELVGEHQGEIALAGMKADMKGHAMLVYAIIEGLAPDGKAGALARGVPNRNGFELWRRIQREYAPDGGNRAFA